MKHFDSSKLDCRDKSLDCPVGLAMIGNEGRPQKKLVNSVSNPAVICLRANNKIL